MFEFSYGEMVEDSPRVLRERERDAMSRGIEMLRKAQQGGPSSRESIDALHYLRQLWTIFLEDMREPHNELPNALKAGIVSIGIWVMKQIDRVRKGEITDLTALIEINEIVRDGLA